MARILVLNGYDLAGTHEEVVAGRCPDHLLLGINYFEHAGHSVEVVPFRRSRALLRANQLLRRSPIPLGDLDQEAAALRAARSADLVYAPMQHVAQLLAYLRAAGRFRRPIVWVVHNPLDCGRLSRFRQPVMKALLRGLDAYPALSEPVARDLARVAGSPDRTQVVSLGPDSSWYPVSDTAGTGVVATGYTKRDFETFAQAAAQTSVRTRIVSSGMPYPELIAMYLEARAVAIPLKVAWPWTMNGLLTLLDALGVGKPVIVTRNPWLDIDVERLGIGIWVAPGDVEGWRDAIRYMDQHPEEALAMGRRARALVDQGGRTSEAFAAQLMDVFDGVLAR